MNIRVDLNTPIKDGTEVVFRSPVDCSQVTGLKVYYIGADGNTASQEFMFADAHGNNVGDIDHLFAENVAVKVILDVTTGMAFVQNADTNAYLEGRFAEKPGKVTFEGGVILTDCESNHNAVNGSIASGLIITRANFSGVPKESDLRYNEAIGEGSVASGMGAVAYSRASKSLGYRTQTGQPPDPDLLEARPEARYWRNEEGDPLYPNDDEGQAAVAIGADTAALGNHSLAGGYSSVANGASSLAFGSNNVADKDYAVAFGYKGSALGKCSLTSGHTVKALANYSSAIGFNLVTSDNSNAVGQMVVGRYNNPEGTEKAMLVVGDGNGENTRRNAFVVDRSGNATVRGRLIAGSIDPNTAKTIVKHTDKGGNTGTDESFLGKPGDYIGQIGVWTDDPVDRAIIYIYCGPGPGWVKIAEQN